MRPLSSGAVPVPTVERSCHERKAGERALIGYIIGAAIGGRLMRGRNGNWHNATTTVLASSAIALTAVVAVITVKPLTALNYWEGVIVAAGIAVLMGAHASVARYLAVTDMTTVVVTSTITAWAGETLWQSDSSRLLNRRVGAILAILVGISWAKPVTAAANAVLPADQTIVYNRTVPTSANWMRKTASPSP